MSLLFVLRPLRLALRVAQRRGKSPVAGHQPWSSPGGFELVTQGVDPSFALPVVLAMVVIPDSSPFGWIQASGLQGKAPAQAHGLACLPDRGSVGGRYGGEPPGDAVRPADPAGDPASLAARPGPRCSVGWHQTYGLIRSVGFGSRLIPRARYPLASSCDQNRVRSGRTNGSR